MYIVCFLYGGWAYLNRQCHMVLSTTPRMCESIAVRDRTINPPGICSGGSLASAAFFRYRTFVEMPDEARKEMKFAHEMECSVGNIAPLQSDHYLSNI